MTGGRNIAGTNIVMPNGSIDPWHALGVLNTTNPGITPIFIHGTAHWCVSCCGFRIDQVTPTQCQYAAAKPV